MPLLDTVFLNDNNNNNNNNINFIPSKNTLHYTPCFKIIYYEVRPESKDTYKGLKQVQYF